MSDHLAGLNPEQPSTRIRHQTRKGKGLGSLPVIAGCPFGQDPDGCSPGCAPAYHRVAHLFINEIDPHRILLLTFSRRAAEEMTRRYDGLFDGRSSSHQSCPDCIIGTRRYDFLGGGAGLG
ncbi:MAG: UvrD-helicase domain-containing protein [Bradyrhizobium sp.]